MLFREQWHYLPVLRIFFKRAWEMSQGRVPAWEWGTWEIEASDAALKALHALRRSKAPISVDIETLGIDPWSVPITCIGVSDLTDTVSLPWHSYRKVRGITRRGASKIEKACKTEK